MRTIKKNVWKPFLFGCIGLVIATVAFASMSNIFYPPGKPGRPIVTDVWNNGCDLNWKIPTTDGGSPITAYYIESRDKYDFIFKKVGATYGNQLQCTISGLIEGSVMEFRVIAENKAGTGEPSDPCDPVTIRNRY